MFIVMGNTRVIQNEVFIFKISPSSIPHAMDIQGTG